VGEMMGGRGLVHGALGGAAVVGPFVTGVCRLAAFSRFTALFCRIMVVFPVPVSVSITGTVTVPAALMPLGPDIRS
jgi:hypothetical protein